MLKALILSILVLAAAVAAAQDARIKPGSALAQDKAELQSSLQQISSLEGVAIFMDIDDKVKLPEAPTSKQGGWSMLYLASLANREWVEIQGVQVFGRRFRTQPSIRIEARLEVARIINSLSEADLMDALNGDLNFAKFPPSDRGKLLNWAFNWPGMTQTSVYDLPHETFNAFRDQATTTTVALMALDKYVVTDTDGRKYEAYSSEGMTKIALSAGQYVEPQYIESPDFDLSSAPTDGELDFGEGSIVSVREVLSRSSRVFSEHYRVDPRLFDDLLFVSGKYTKERFEGCMKRVMFLEPFRSVGESPELNELIDRLADRLQGINERLLENRGSRRTLQSLELSDPRAYARLVRTGIDPSTASVVVRPGFFLRMDPNVYVLLGTERRIVEGEEVLVTKRRQVLIGIGF